MLAAGLVLFCVTFLVAARANARHEGYYSTIGVFGLGALLYYVAIPVEMSVVGSVRLDTDIGAVRFEAAQQGEVVLLGAMAFAAFAAGYALSGFRPLGRAPAAAPQADRRLPRSMLIFTVGSVLLLVAGFHDELVATGSYKGSYEVIYNSSGFAVLVKYATLGLAVLAALLRQRRGRTWVAALICVALVAWGVYSSTKHPILLAGLAMASPMVGHRSRRPWYLAAFLLVSVPLAVAGPILFSQYRGGIPLSLARTFAKGTFFRQTDPAGPTVSLVDAVSEPQEWLSGESYLLSSVTWVPRAAWPSRPLDMAEQFARRRVPRWKAGMGLGYSLLAESYVNFGWFGPLLQYLGLGLLWGLAWRVLRSWFARVGEGYWRAMYTTVGFYQLVVMHRGPTSSITTSMMQLFVPLLVLSALTDRRRAAARAAPAAALRIPPPRTPAPRRIPATAAALPAD